MEKQKGIPDKRNYLLIVGGPTASGKTEFAIRLAQYFQTEILSADSRQFYREMSIGTAKPNKKELDQVIHHFIGHLSIETPYNVGDFERDAISLLDTLFNKYKIVILCGGSGLYIKAVCEGLDAIPEVPENVRSALKAEYDQGGIRLLQDELARTDPVYYQEVDLQNPRRLLRALSVIRASGRPFSYFRRQNPTQRNFLPIFLKMDWPREKLYRRIDQRVDQMFREGLLEEVKALYPYRHLQALQTVGYQEIFDHIEGLTTLEEARDLIKRNSRRYAKRQLTWFRRDNYWTSFHPGEFEQALTYIEHQMKD